MKFQIKPVADCTYVEVLPYVYQFIVMYRQEKYLRSLWLYFCCLGNEAIESRKLVTVLLEKMASIGYFIDTGIDITRKTNDKSLLLFRRGYPLATKFFCLSLNSSDYVRLINAPSNIVEVMCQL